MTKETEYKYDLFISYASVDKSFVQSLVDTLAEYGLTVWYDNGELRFGDSILRFIEDGLENSRFFLLVLSPGYFKGSWPQFETGVALSRVGKEHILPLYNGINPQDVEGHLPLLTDKIGLETKKHSLQELAEMILARVRRDRDEGTSVVTK